MDNLVNSEIPLDLGFCVREGMPRTGERTPTGVTKRVLIRSLRATRGKRIEAHEVKAVLERSEKPLLRTEHPGNRGLRTKQTQRTEQLGNQRQRVLQPAERRMGDPNSP